MGDLSSMAILATNPDRATSLKWHLRVNHDPSVSLDWIPCCEWVIERARDNLDLTVPAPIPESYATMSAQEVLSGLHLEPWVRFEKEIRELDEPEYL